MFAGKWVKDIKEKTSGMSKEKRIEYIAEYYWYHILIFCLIVVLLILTVYHLAVGRRSSSFTCIIVNEKIDLERDQELCELLSKQLKLSSSEIRADSSYRISYTGHKEEESNESNYEKFFFGWSEGEFDAVIMPETFYQYCKELGAEFRNVSGRKQEYLPLNKTVLKNYINDNKKDSMLIVFPSTGRHEKKTLRFVNSITEGDGTSK